MIKNSFFIFILLVFNLFAQDNIPNELISKNPKITVETYRIQPKKNSANLNIGVTKITPQPISGKILGEYIYFNLNNCPTYGSNSKEDILNLNRGLHSSEVIPLEKDSNEENIFKIKESAIIFPIFYITQLNSTTGKIEKLYTYEKSKKINNSKIITVNAYVDKRYSLWNYYFALNGDYKYYRDDFSLHIEGNYNEAITYNQLSDETPVTITGILSHYSITFDDIGNYCFREINNGIRTGYDKRKFPLKEYVEKHIFSWISDIPTTIDYALSNGNTLRLIYHIVNPDYHGSGELNLTQAKDKISFRRTNLNYPSGTSIKSNNPNISITNFSGYLPQTQGHYSPNIMTSFKVSINGKEEVFQGKIYENEKFKISFSDSGDLEITPKTYLGSYEDNVTINPYYKATSISPLTLKITKNTSAFIIDNTSLNFGDMITNGGYYNAGSKIEIMNLTDKKINAKLATPNIKLTNTKKPEDSLSVNLQITPPITENNKSILYISGDTNVTSQEAGDYTGTAILDIFIE
ncbi:MAG: hypothetical protein ACRCRV_00655 [Cetobacterium sp.]